MSKKQKTKRKQTPKQFQGTRQERAAHFAALAKAKQAAATAAAHPTKANTDAARVAVEAAGRAYVNKQTVENLAKAEAVAAKRSAAAKLAAATRKAKKQHEAEVHAARVAGAKKAAQTRARNKEIALNKKYGEDVAAVREMLIYGSLQRREHVALNEDVKRYVTGLKQKGLISQDIRDIYGGGYGYTEKGSNPNMSVKDLEKYWSHERVADILDKTGVNTDLAPKFNGRSERITAKNLINKARSLSRGDILEGFTSDKRQQRVAAEVMSKRHIDTVSKTDLAEVALFNRLRSKLYSFYETLGLDSEQVQELVRKKAHTLGKYISDGVLNLDINMAIDKVVSDNPQDYDKKEAANAKRSIAKLRKQLSSGTGDLLTNTKDGEILAEIVDILEKYGL